MYTPARFQEPEESKIIELIRQNPFATLISNDGAKPVATHLPIEIVEENNKLFLTAHLARANPQWRTFAANAKVLAVFQGAHAYISPRWYSEPLANVPTWNYSAVHVYGKPHLIEDESALFNLLKKMINRYEQGTDYKLEAVAPDYLGKLIKAIVGFQIEITNIEHSFKLSQHHRDLPHYENVIAELERRGDENSLGIANAMRGERSAD